MTTGEFSEFLPSGGRLVVNVQSWYVHYYFPGTEIRLGGESYYIHDNQIDSYIAAWQDNLKQYKELKATLPEKSESVTRGKLGMIIAVNSRIQEGVSLSYHGINAKNEKDLKKILDSYEYARNRANLIMSFLRQL
ncbi:MAG: hypothetical protein J1F69_00450 [Clostridiales bacterium]|nr:hypothetical protein [Clostridiales bacterium]